MGRYTTNQLRFLRMNCKISAWAISPQGYVQTSQRHGPFTAQSEIAEDCRWKGARRSTWEIWKTSEQLGVWTWCEFTFFFSSFVHQKQPPHNLSFASDIFFLCAEYVGLTWVDVIGSWTMRLLISDFAFIETVSPRVPPNPFKSRSCWLVQLHPFLSQRPIQPSIYIYIIYIYIYLFIIYIYELVCSTTPKFAQGWIF